MSDYKLLITDLDGTAVPVGGDISTVLLENSSAVSSAQQAGKHVSAATGRMYQEASGVAKKLGIHGPIVVDGGTRIVDTDSGKTVWEKRLPHESSEYVLSVFRKYSEEEDCYVLHDNSDLDGDYQVRPEVIQIDSPRFLYLIGITTETATKIANEINLTDAEDVAHITPGWKGEGYHDVHVVHREATKEHAITELMDILGISKAETIGMGDSGNDVPLLEGVGFKIAVGNAEEALKEMADYIAPRQDEAALGHVIEKFLL